MSKVVLVASCWVGARGGSIFLINAGSTHTVSVFHSIQTPAPIHMIHTLSRFQPIHCPPVTPEKRCHPAQGPVLVNYVRVGGGERVDLLPVVLCKRISNVLLEVRHRSPRRTESVSIHL